MIIRACIPASCRAYPTSGQSLFKQRLFVKLASCFVFTIWPTGSLVPISAVQLFFCHPFPRSSTLDHTKIHPVVCVCRGIAFNFPFSQPSCQYPLGLNTHRYVSSRIVQLLMMFGSLSAKMLQYWVMKWLYIYLLGSLYMNLLLNHS